MNARTPTPSFWDHGDRARQVQRGGEPFRSAEMTAAPQDANDFPYCFSCITIVYEAMKAAQS